MQSSFALVLRATPVPRSHLWPRRAWKRSKLDWCHEGKWSRFFSAFSFCVLLAVNGSSVLYRPSSMTFVLKGDPGVDQCHVVHPLRAPSALLGAHRQFTPYRHCAALVVISLWQPFRTQVAFSLTPHRVPWLLNDGQRSFTPFINPALLFSGQRAKLSTVYSGPDVGGTAATRPQITPGMPEWTVAARAQN